MNCGKVRDVLLTDHLDNTLGAAAREEIERHLVACADCRAFRDSVAAAVAPLREARQAPVPETLWLSVKEGLERERRREEAGVLSFLRHGWINAAAAAAMLIGTLLAGNYLASDIWGSPAAPAAAYDVAGNLEMTVFDDLPSEQVETVYRSYVGG